MNQSLCPGLRFRQRGRNATPYNDAGQLISIYKRNRRLRLVPRLRQSRSREMAGGNEYSLGCRAQGSSEAVDFGAADRVPPSLTWACT